MADIYDGAFRTILNDCRQLIIPVINEVFMEKYTGKEKVEFSPNEHFLDQQDTADVKRITDTNFTVYGTVEKKYHWECESTPDNRILVRLFEYDAQIALDQGEVVKQTLTVVFPNTALLYLRCSQNTPDQMMYMIKTPGGDVSYEIPVMKVQEYTLDDIFEKKLLLLIPFYIFSHEKKFEEYEADNAKLDSLKKEYQDIAARLDSLVREGVIGTFDKRTIIELSRDVLNELAKKYANIRKGVGGIMGGTLLATEARAIKNEGISQGISQGIRQGIVQGISQGENLLAELMNRLFADGRTEDARLAASDETVRKRLYQEYGMTDGH